jgi:hypothetical protein
VSFDASQSSSPVGAIASYQWEFGDGQGATTTSPAIQHAYARPGVYTARLTVTNTAGTSTGQVFTGQTVSNQGGPQATTTQVITVPPPRPGSPSPGPPSPGPPRRVSLEQLRVEPGAVSIAGRRQAARCVKPNRANRHHARCRRAILVRITYTLTATTAVRLTIARQSAGRRVGHHCLAPTRKNRRHARCLRVTTITGHLTQNATTGRDTLVFYGTIGGHLLAPGSYQLTLTPSGGVPHSTTLKINR